jgi:hypothetical protein
MYGIRAPRSSATRERRFDSLRVSHFQDMNEMLDIVQDIVMYMYSLVPFAMSLVVYFRRTGAGDHI